MTREEFNVKIESKLMEIHKLFSEYVRQFPEYEQFETDHTLSMAVGINSDKDYAYLSAFSMIDAALKSDVEKYKTEGDTMPDAMFYVNYSSCIEKGTYRQYGHGDHLFVEDTDASEVTKFNRYAEYTRRKGSENNGR